MRIKSTIQTTKMEQSSLLRLFTVLVLMVVPLTLAAVDDQTVGLSNIRHSRARSLYQHPSRHRPYELTDDGAVMLTNITYIEVVDDNHANATNLRYAADQVLEDKNAKMIKKPRRVTVEGNFTVAHSPAVALTNNTWKHMDKSVLFMGERALKNNAAAAPPRRKKSRTTVRTPLATGTGGDLDSTDFSDGDDYTVLDGIEDDDDDDDDDDDNNNHNKSPIMSEMILESTRSGHVDIVTRFLRIVESQHILGENCTAGTDLNLGEGVVDQYAQERFRIEAEVAVNRANMLTRLWKYADPAVMSEYLLHASVFAMVEFDDDIFAAGNCYDQRQYRDYGLFCPYAYRLPDGTVLIKDLSVEYKYLSNTSEWFYIARKNAENVIRNYNQFSRGYNTYKSNETTHTERIPDEILSVGYEDGKWSKPYYDCGGGNIWMLTYTVPFFGYVNNTYFFKGTSGIDVDLRRVDIDQCPLPKDSTQLNIFAASDKCKKTTTECVALPGLGFRRGSYICICRKGFYFPDTAAERRYYNGTVIEEEYEKLIVGEQNRYGATGVYECLSCAEGCESCEDGRPCVVSLNWVMRTVILVLACVIICCLPFVVIFTWKYGSVTVVRAASPVLLRVIILGAFLIYLTTIVMYPQPSIYTCTLRIWLREIGFSLTYGALMLKTWRISVIFRVRSAKAVKITDMNLLKRLGIIIVIFTVFLVIRTLVAPPVVIIGRTADDLKAYLCQTDWWDHSFSMLEVMFLIWGIRLCIVVRKAPSEFNESRFISMAIYNEFLLSVFLNISMLFLQKPANPDLLFIIFFCHTQLTVTLLLCLIFGSKAYMVFKGHDKNERSSGMMSKTQASTLLGKGRSSNSQYTSTNSSEACLEYSKISDQHVQDEFLRLCGHLRLLKERNLRLGNKDLALKITAMQDAAIRHDADKRSRKNSTTTTGGINLLSIAACSPNVGGGGGTSNGSTAITDQNNGHHTLSAPATLTLKRPSVSFAAPETVEVVDAAASDATEEQPVAGDADAQPPVMVAVDSANGDGGGGGGGGGDGVTTAGGKNDRVIKSGHAHTHDIVINLDDNVRYSEEVTV